MANGFFMVHMSGPMCTSFIYLFFDFFYPANLFFSTSLFAFYLSEMIAWRLLQVFY